MTRYLGAGIGDYGARGHGRRGAGAIKNIAMEIRDHSAREHGCRGAREKGR